MEQINLKKLDLKPLNIAYAGTGFGFLMDEFPPVYTIHSVPDFSSLKQYLADLSLLNLPDVIMIEADEQGTCFDLIEELKKKPLLQGLIIILLSKQVWPGQKQRALKLCVHDFYVYPFPLSDLIERINFMVKFKLIKPALFDLAKQVDVTYTMPLSKRMFDIFFSSMLLLCLSPLMLVVALIIRLGSKGDVIYKSKRVGTGYQIFDFYKFRSMKPGSDQQISQLAAQNQYAGTGTDPNKSVFIKIKNDPRVTKFGRFIRKTSIDELPQLFNILKGDMSVVGNRPLPLYEAEMLTSNEWAFRFLGPAGLTGLWQISKRGGAEVSERERKKLDNFYAQRYSFWLDMKILLKTFSSFIQKEKV
jgi:lipopolysaccharide/colanic/teichoic acid biosynthesis glycosyltransferase